MMRELLSIGLIGIAVIGARAQQTTKAADANNTALHMAQERLTQEVAKVQLTAVSGMNCPVFASAERGGGGAVIQTRKGEPASPATELHLHFGPGEKAGISEATVTLHGTDASPRAELAYSSASSNMMETFHLTGSADHSLTAAALNPNRVVNVRWVSISELKFRDGSRWRPSGYSYCHIQPNGFRRVAATQ